jgi:hypothetical protein
MPVDTISIRRPSGSVIGVFRHVIHTRSPSRRMFSFSFET